MKIKLLTILASLILVTSCSGNANRSGPGLIYTGTTDAIAFDNAIKPSRKGEACSTKVLSLVTFGDASVEAAKKDADIKKIATADTKYFNILGVYGTACTVVRGE